MMAGKAYSRAARGLILVTSSLYAHIMSKIYNCPIKPTSSDANAQVESGESVNEALFDIDNSDKELQDLCALLSSIILKEGELSNAETDIIQSVMAKVKKLEITSVHLRLPNFGFSLLT